MRNGRPLSSGFLGPQSDAGCWRVGEGACPGCRCAGALRCWASRDLRGIPCRGTEGAVALLGEVLAMPMRSGVRRVKP